VSMSVPLSEYVNWIPKTMTISPPGFNRQCIVLTEVVQLLMRRILAILPDHLLLGVEF
jgi:hypothetical protein